MESADASKSGGEARGLRRSARDLRDLRSVLLDRSRRAAIEVGIRDVRGFVDPYLLARKAVTFFKTLLNSVERLVSGDMESMGSLLSSVADELAASAPSISPAFVIASILQVLYDELTESEADIRLIWKAMSKVSDTVEEYLNESLERVADACSTAFPEKTRLAVIGGGMLTLSCLEALKPGSTVTILESYPERDGVWLYQAITRKRRDLVVRLLPDAFQWQAATESNAVIVLLSGVGRDGYVSARAGSYAMALTAKRLKRKVYGLTFMLAVEPARYLRGIMVPEARVTFTERGGERLTAPSLDVFNAAETLDAVITDRGVYSDLARLSEDVLEYISQMVDKAFKSALDELGFRQAEV